MAHEGRGLIIVFGAGGFIGTYLVDELVTQGYDVLASGLDDVEQEYYRGRNMRYTRVDITNQEDFSSLPVNGVSSIVNLASLQPANVRQGEYRSTEYVKVNVLGTLNILEFCRKTGVHRFIHAISHRSVAGLWAPGRVITEDDTRAIKYAGEYAMFSISESAAADCIRHYSDQYGIQGIVFRLPPVYGYGPHTEIFRDGKPHKTGFQIFIENASSGNPLELWGDCDEGRDIIYVKDVVSAIMLALKSENAIGLYNIASGRLLSLREEAEEIIRAFSPRGHSSKIVNRPETQNSIEPFLYDISKARRDFGWAPKYSFREILEDYKNEMKSGRFSFLVKRREAMMAAGNLPH
jgi:UDP-glucose 4-epimerase